MSDIGTMEQTSDLLKLQSNPQSIAQIEPYVNYVMQQHDICQSVYGNILIALTEAVTNAIVHGNKEDGSKVVTVNIKGCEDKKVVFQVIDQGTGFDHDSLPDPTAPENLLKLGGRGVFLIKQLADSVTFCDEGRCVEILFKY